MANIQKYALMGGQVVKTSEAQVSVASSAVLYGLSVYSVFFGKHTKQGMLCFRVPEHLARLRQSARIIGLTNIQKQANDEHLTPLIKKLIQGNNPKSDQFFRVTIHATELLPGVRTADLKLTVSVFMYDATCILPRENTRIKTSLWRRTADTAIPARAKVNGAYVNSALAKQDALSSGYDDCLFLNQHGYVSELSAANIFMIKNGTLITPDCSSDILEGITRRSILELAQEHNIPITERKVALTELYAADEVFACGTSAFVSPVIEIDNRVIGPGATGNITEKLRTLLETEQASHTSAWTRIL
jgi:branched-chain amino acid aminotransferase